MMRPCGPASQRHEEGDAKEQVRRDALDVAGVAARGLRDVRRREQVARARRGSSRSSCRSRRRRDRCARRAPPAARAARGRARRRVPLTPPPTTTDVDLVGRERPGRRRHRPRCAAPARPTRSAGRTPDRRASSALAALCERFLLAGAKRSSKRSTRSNRSRLPSCLCLRHAARVLGRLARGTAAGGRPRSRGASRPYPSCSR